MSINTYDIEIQKFIGPGNAKVVVDYIKNELPPLSWNIIAVKNMGYIVKANIKALMIQPTDEFPDFLLEAINETMEKEYNKKLPIF